MKQLESKLMELNAKLPQLPENFKASLAKWLWVLVIIAIVINIMGIMTILGIGALGGVLLFSAGFGAMSIQLWIMIITGVVGMGVTVVAEIIAIKPLKEKKYRGWYIAFCVACLQFVFSVIYDITSGSVSSIFSALISLAISLYLLSQVRSHFTTEQNCAAILGMRYFGEIKKGTLTLAWGIAARNGYAACHGGLKRYRTKEGGRSFVLAVFGLSGSGKSTITHAKHRDKYEITVLHDDALAVNVDGKYAIAMEPAYFDKVQDYPIGCEANKFLVTLQNCGVTIDADGKRIVVPEDIRNGNGRAIKSRFWSPDRVDRIDEPLSAICWLMKDPTLPPILRLTDPSLAATMGATLATKRTSAERLAPGVDPNLLVIESYANPFRTYPLSMDYKRFKKLIEDGVDCFVLNTGDFMGKKIPPQTTLSLLESVVDGTAKYLSFGGIPGMETIALEDFRIDFSDDVYITQLYNRFIDRLQFIRSRETEKGGMDRLPPDAAESLKNVAKNIFNMAKDSSGIKPVAESNMEIVIRGRRIAEHAKKLVNASRKRFRTNENGL